MSEKKQVKTAELEEQELKGGFVQYLTFKVGSEIYGIDVKKSGHDYLRDNK